MLLAVIEHVVPPDDGEAFHFGIQKEFRRHSGDFEIVYRHPVLPGTQRSPAEDLHHRNVVRQFYRLIVVVENPGEIAHHPRIAIELIHIDVGVFHAAAVQLLKRIRHREITGRIRLLVPVVVQNQQRPGMRRAFPAFRREGVLPPVVAPRRKIVLPGKLFDLLPQRHRQLRRVAQRHGNSHRRAIEMFCQIIQIAYFSTRIHPRLPLMVPH